METLKIISSICLFLYPLYCVLREGFLINSGDNLTQHQRQVRLSILVYLGVFYLIFVYWCFNRKGFDFGFTLKKIDQDFLMFILIFAQISTSITRHFRKERTGEELILNYKEEFTRSINFNFIQIDSFEKIIKKFIKEQKEKGIEVEIIDSSTVDLEPFKHLKKGEIFKFSPKTWLEKVTDLIEHNYFYHNKGIVVFNMHEHIKLAETLTAIDYEIVLYLKYKNKKELIKIIIPIGESYTIPKGVLHAVIIAKIGKLGLKWT